MNNWLDALRRECEKSSQERIARRLGVSAAVINQALKGKYKGNIDRIQALVEGAFMGATVDCPMIGEMPRDRCIEHQGRPFAATNPARVQLYHACRNGCPNSRIRD